MMVSQGASRAAVRAAKKTRRCCSSVQRVKASSNWSTIRSRRGCAGGTRGAARLNWPGRVKPGTVVDEPMHIVDMYPTLAALAGASTAKCKTLDGLNVWPAVAEGKPSGRTEVVYDVEPFRAALRQGPWKLVWQTTLPSKTELFNLVEDPSEKTDLAAKNPQKVAELKARVEELARTAVPPLLMQEAVGAASHVLFSSVALPADVKELETQP